MFRSIRSRNLFIRAFKKKISAYAAAQTRSSCTLDHSPNTKLSKSIIERYLCLPIPECKVQATYIWIDGTGDNLRSKTRTLDFVPKCFEEIPRWTYDGSSTFQSMGDNSDTYLMPVALYNDPIRRGNNKLVLCDTYTPTMKPMKTNNRCECFEAMNAVCEHEPMWGLEQEYQLMDVDGRPFGWPIMHGEPAPNGMYYCGVGGSYAYGREVVESHYRAALYSGVDLEGTNAEVTPGQWEYQIGTTAGIKAGDDLWVARFIMGCIAEEYGLNISLHPKLFPNWNGAGCHCNFSTKTMRGENGITVIEKAIDKLSKRHKEHMCVYDPRGGKDNVKRLTGKHETSSTTKFTWGVADRGTSVRIPRAVADKKRGWLEDRRPSSNCDPYAVMNALVRTILIDK